MLYRVHLAMNGFGFDITVLTPFLCDCMWNPLFLLYPMLKAVCPISLLDVDLHLINIIVFEKLCLTSFV